MLGVAVWMNATVCRPLAHDERSPGQGAPHYNTYRGVSDQHPAAGMAGAIVRANDLRPHTGGESGILALNHSLDSVGCRFHNAAVAVDAIDAAALCPPLLDLD